MDQVIALMIIAIVSEENEENRNQRKRKWTKEWLENKKDFSNKKLLKTISDTEPNDYKNYMRMSEHTFQELLVKVTPFIKKADTFMRDAIPVETRLAITLRFLATGNSFEDLKFGSAVSPQAIGKIIIETCEAINAVLKHYIKLSRSSEEWKSVSKRFFEKTGFPHCVGAIDGKHVNIIKPSNSGSFYFNYKKTFSIVLMAVVNADCEFIMADVGTNGRISDGGVFSNTKFFHKLNNNKLGLPDPCAVLPNGDLLPYVFVADAAFPLREDLMKPYAHGSLTNDEILFNRKLSSARVRVENTFGILAMRFRVLLTTINLCPEKVTTIVLSCCYLHNFLKKQEAQFNQQTSVLAPALASQQDGLFQLESSISRNPRTQAKIVRHKFRDILPLLNE